MNVAKASRQKLAALVAILVTAVLALPFAMLPSFAADGGDGEGGDTGGVGIPAVPYYKIFDSMTASSNGNPTQGTGDPSITWFKQRLLSENGFGKFTAAADPIITNTCRNAMSRATARSSDKKRPSRVVGMFIAGAPASQAPAGELGIWTSSKPVWNDNFKPALDRVAAGDTALLPGYKASDAHGAFNKAFQSGYQEGYSYATASGGDGIQFICVALNSEEPSPPPPPPPPPEEPPAPPVKSITGHVYADSMINTTSITTRTGVGGKSLVFTDDINTNGVNVELVSVKIVQGNTTDITDKFKIDVTGQGKDLSKIVAAWKGGDLPENAVFTMQIKLKAQKPNGNKVVDTGTVQWNQKPGVKTETLEFPTYDFKPNKSWVKKAGEIWQAVTDPEWTNKTGADGNYFMNGDDVASVVNGIVGADFYSVPAKFTLVDDYSDSASILDDSATVKGAKVYKIKATENSKPTVNDIIKNGTDVTKNFDIKADKKIVTATANEAERKTMLQAESPVQYTLMLPFKVQFNSAATLKAYGLKPGQELTTCEAPGGGNAGDAGKPFINKGSETINEHVKETNKPPICITVPPNVKEVRGAESMNSGDGDKNGKGLVGNEQLEYRLRTKPAKQLPMGGQISQMSFTDTYHELFTPDKKSLKVFDANTGKALDAKSYKVDWQDAKRKIVVNMDKGWLNAQPTGKYPALEVRFTGTVNMDKVDKQTLEQWLTKTVNNKQELRVNNDVIPSNEVVNNPIDPPTSKRVEDKEGSGSISVDGKKAFVGDRLYYKIALDSTMPKQGKAYNLMRLGIIDDFDERYLDVKAKEIKVMDGNTDISKQFNFQVKDGKAYIFAKTVDTKVAGTDKVLKGNPQPNDLSKYAMSKLDPKLTPAVDQKLLNRKLTVVIPATVTKVTKDGEAIKNQAMRILDDSRKLTNIVQNPVVDINPKKDVVVKLGDKSHNGKEIALQTTFLYKLQSSTIPKDRVNPAVTDWKITDKLDTKHDKFTGQWAVYTDVDLNVAGIKVKKGDRIAGTNFDLVSPQPLFKLTNNNGTITLESTKWANDNVWSKLKTDMSWTGYIQVERIKPSERVENTLDEHFNKLKKRSNTVWTHTPPTKPSIKLVKFDEASGIKEGDRNTREEGLKLPAGNKKPTAIVYRIINNGDTPIGRLQLSDVVEVGDADLGELVLPDNWSTLVLKPGEHVDVKGSVSNVEGLHKNNASVTGNPVMPCVDEQYADPFAPAAKGKGESTPESSKDSKVCYNTDVELTDEDPWHASQPLPPKPELPVTGAGIAGLAVTGLLAGLGGAGALVSRRNRK